MRNLSNRRLLLHVAGLANFRKQELKRMLPVVDGQTSEYREDYWLHEMRYAAIDELARRMDEKEVR